MKPLNDTRKVERPAPAALTISQPFWDATRDKRLMLQFDPRSGKYQFFPRPVSIYDGMRPLEWREASGEGEIFSFTIAERARPPFQGHEPFAMGIVTLKENVNMMANVINCSREELRVGLAVKVCWLPLPEGMHLPAFEPVR